MSDGQLKNFEEAANAFYSSVSGRTRSKRDSHCRMEYERHGPSCSSQNAGHASGEISALNRQKSAGELRSKSSSINKRSIPMKLPRRVGRPIKNFGNKSADVDKKKPMTQRIDESKFSNRKMCYQSETRHSTMHGLNTCFNASSSAKNAYIVSKKPSATPEIIPEDISHQRVLQEGNDSEDLDSNGIEIVDKDSFIVHFPCQNSCSMSKTGSSSKEDLNASFSAATSRKDATNLCRREPSAGYSESLGSKDAFRGSDHAWPHESRSYIQLDSDSDDMKSEDIEVERTDEAGFRNQKSHFESKIGRSPEQVFCSSSSNKKVDGAEENSSTIARKVNIDEDIHPEESGIEEIDESKFRQFTTKIGPSTWQDSNRHFAATSANSLREFISSSSSESDSDDIDIDLQGEEVSSCDAKHETCPGIASRTRSKMGNKEKHTEVGNVSSILSIDSDSSPTDSGYSSSHDDVESSDGGIEFLDLNLKACEVVSAETEDCSKEGGAAEQNEESHCEQPESKKNHKEHKHEPASQIQKEDCRKEVSVGKHALDGPNLKLSSRKRQISYDTSGKPARKAQKLSKVAGDKEKTKTTSSNVHVHDKSETLCMIDETNVPVDRKQVSPQQNDICSLLADAVLGRVQFPENKEDHKEAEKVPASQIQSTLPLKFSFEDEVPEPVTKTDYEKEIEEQFSLLESYFYLEELQSFDYPAVDLENGDSPAEETQHARCCRGMHELVIEDEEGLICSFCRHVELGPKDIMPPWAEIPCRVSQRKRLPEMEQHLEFDELHLQSSVNDVADLRSATGTVWSINPGVQESMYKHQREGFEFLWKNLSGSINLDDLKRTDLGEVGGCIISHAPGTGKTRLTIVFLETYLKLFPNCYPVIIAPASMLLTWEEEFRKWNVEFPFLNLCNIELSAKEKDVIGPLAQPKIRDKKHIRMIKIYSWSKGRRILGISYSLFERLTGKEQKENMRKILLEKPGLVVLDEGHTPRNKKSGIWKALLELKTGKRIILSGTPFQNNFEELFNTLRIVRPAVADVLSQERTFDGMEATRNISSRRKHEEHFQSSLSEEAIDRAVEKLKKCMFPFVHVHKGNILQQNLPGLRDCVVLLKPPALQKSLIERLEGTNNFKFEHEVALTSVHPYLFQHCKTTEDQLIGIDMGAVEASKLNHVEGVKTRFVVELIRLSTVVEEKVLIFSQFIKPLQLIKEQLKELLKWVEGRQILQMQGKVGVKQRQLLINLFNDPQSESKIMLASTKCCSEGISLIGASRVVLLDVVWNPSVERQAICRAYRIGQKKFVYTYHLMTSGTTEADKYCRQAEKERLSELVFSSSNESNLQKHASVGIEDRILELMVGHKSLKEMFEKIINQPKDTDLIQTFGLTS